MTEYYDLSQPLWEYSPVSVNTPPVTFFEIAGLVRTGRITRGIHTSLHAGTHIDAPCHFSGSQVTLDQIPISTLCGTGVILDMPREAWGVITANDLEKATPKIEPGDRVILNTGWHRYHDTDPEEFMLRPPGCDKSAIDWFVERKVTWVGSDTPSPEHTFCIAHFKRPVRPDIYTDEVMASIDRERFPVTYGHRTLLNNHILMVESLGGEIDKVTGRRLTLLALPPKLMRAEAAQARVVAVVGEL